MLVYVRVTCILAGCHSDPYVKVSFRGPTSVFPHFTTMSSDPVPDFYKTKTIQKVHRLIDVVVCDALLLVDTEPLLEFWFQIFG